MATFAMARCVGGASYSVAATNNDCDMGGRAIDAKRPLPEYGKICIFVGG